MKILITEAYSASNIGDLELVDRTIAITRTRFPTAQLVCLATDPSSFKGHIDIGVQESVFSRLNYVAAQRVEKLFSILKLFIIISCVSIFALVGGAPLRAWIGLLANFSKTLQRLHSYVDADRVIAVGGGYFANRYWKHSFLTLWTWWVAQRMGIPVETMPISMEITHPVLRYVVRLFGAKLTWRVRDSLSLDALRACGRDGVLVPDLAFINYNESIAQDSPERNGKLMIALVGSDYLDAKSASNLYRDLAEVCAEQFSGYEISLLAMHSSMQGTSIGGDVAACEKFAGCLKEQGIPSEYIRAKTYFEVLTTCGQMDVVISARMHAGIAALCSGARVGLLAYEKKHFALMNDLSLSEYVVSVAASKAELTQLAKNLRASARDKFVTATRKYCIQLKTCFGLPQ